MPRLRIPPKSSLLLLVLGGTAWAAAGDPITNNQYRVDLTRTVASGSTRKIGMGGAFVGLAEGNAAIPDNPAAVAYRARAFMRPWELDMVLSTLVTTDDDADNSGSTSLVPGSRVLGDFGLMAQHKHVGVGGVAQYSVVASNDLPADQEAQFLSGTAAVGYSFLDDQLAVGFSMNPVGARVHSKQDRLKSFDLTGLGFGGGFIWHPQRAHWRFGAAYTSSVSSQDEGVLNSSTPIKSGNLIVPNGVYVTNTLALGTAYEWNHFPFWRARPAIATFDMRVFGDSPNDVNGTSAFVSQTSKPSGQKTIVTLHTGLEVETVPKHLRLRVGTYREPSRYDNVSTRYHITGGFELRLTPFDIWDHRPLAISYAIDSAPRYLVHSISIWLYTFTVPVP